MEAARSSVAVRVKKFLTLSWDDKVALLDHMLMSSRDSISSRGST